MLLETRGYVVAVSNSPKRIGQRLEDIFYDFDGLPINENIYATVIGETDRADLEAQILAVGSQILPRNETVKWFYYRIVAE